MLKVTTTITWRIAHRNGGLQWQGGLESKENLECLFCLHLLSGF